MRCSSSGSANKVTRPRPEACPRTSPRDSGPQWRCGRTGCPASHRKRPRQCLFGEAHRTGERHVARVASRGHHISRYLQKRRQKVAVIEPRQLTAVASTSMARSAHAGTTSYARRRHPSLGRHALHRSLSEHFVELSNHTTLLSASPVVHSRHTFESARIRADRALSMATSGFSPTTIRTETKPLEEFSCPFCSNNPAVRPDRAMRGVSSPANSPADAESLPQPSFEQVFYCPFAPDSVSKRRRYETGTANTALTTAFF